MMLRMKQMYHVRKKQQYYMKNILMKQQQQTKKYHNNNNQLLSLLKPSSYSSNIHQKKVIHCIQNNPMSGPLSIRRRHHHLYLNKQVGPLLF